MVDDGLESFLIAGKYLFNKTEKFSDLELNKIKDLLIQQKKSVEAYTDEMGDYLLTSGSAQAVVGQSAYNFRAIKKSKDIKIVTPKEGSFIIVDAIMIPKHTYKDDNVYKFINFLYRDNIIENTIDEFAYLPVLDHIIDKTDLSYLGDKKEILSQENFKKLSFFKRSIPVKKLTELWVDVKAS